MRNLNSWLTDNYGLKIEPDDGRWTAILTSYDDEEKFIGIGSFPSSAVEDALAKAEATGKHPREFQALQDLDSDDADSWVCASCDIPAALDNGKPVCLKCGNDTDFKRADTDDIGVCPDECNFDLCQTCVKKEKGLVLQVSKRHVNLIEVMKAATCVHCKGKLKKGITAKWARSHGDVGGGLFHTHCIMGVEDGTKKISPKVFSNVMRIQIQQLSLCTACNKEIPKGADGVWVRVTKDNGGGIYHPDCYKE